MNQYKVLFILAISVVTSMGLVTPLKAYAADIWVSCASPPDGTSAPADGTLLSYAVINNNLISSTGIIPDDIQGNITQGNTGWNPDGNTTSLNVQLPDGSGASKSSVIAISTNDPVNFNLCGVNWVNPSDVMVNAKNFTK